MAMNKKKKLDEIYKAIFIIGGLSDGELNEERTTGVERDIKRAIKTIFRESGLLKTIRVDKVRVPRLEEEEDEETT